MNSTNVVSGSRVVITDSDGTEHEVEALTEVQETGYSFPIIWVNRPLYDGGFEPVPWPADAVRLADDSESSA
jgi:hypothetical protein